MASAVLPVVGAAAGFMIGGPGGAVTGANLGSAANNLVLPAKRQTVKLPTQQGPRLGDLRVQLSSYGEVIPKVYGSMRLAGNIIWATDIKEVKTEHVHTETSRSGGKGGGGRRTVTTTHTTITYSYFVSLAIAICEGEISEIIRIWADSKLLTEDILKSNQGKYNIHLGSEGQMPDDIIGKYKRPGTYPAYRGLCYVVLEDFPLEQFGNRIPNFSFEVKRSVRFRPAVEEKIKEVILIPGAGEFVYSDRVHSKQVGIETENLGPLGKKSYLNMHNYANKANMLVALEQMARTLPNLEWVALVVTWFATDSKAGYCRIVPKVEYHSDNAYIFPSDWQVAGINRDQAEIVLYIGEVTPTYGGTPSDDTVVAICRRLRERGYKIMFYPLIFVDELEPSRKPWRGRITANSRDEIDNWFNNPKHGYNRFIMHYTRLVADKVDAFIIGSEMIGLTSFTDKQGSYPAVDQYIRLAGKVKAALGDNVPITYAADWSEYHHTSGGRFNLDPLWASPNIDFVGIDAYFPLTEDLSHSEITEELIKVGWESGEGWDYYYDGGRENKNYFASESPHAPYKYAWKNLEYWWSTRHQNPDGSYTEWQPKMKPVWFTEFGFPSVDACSNQPNVFYDPSSIESFFPRGSSGKVNFLAQRQALNATLDYLDERTAQEGLEQLVAKRFVWTYDARPFPFWPDFKNVWQDGILWYTGHWINGKLGVSSLGAIIAEILASVGLKPGDYDVSRLTGDVQGYIINRHITAREAIEQLQNAYFFDTVESDGILKFTLRLEGNAVTEIDDSDLIPTSNNDIKNTLEISITQELELPQKVSVTHIDARQNYDLVTVQTQRQTVQTVEQVNFSLPIVLDHGSAKQIADITLYNAWQERNNYKLTLPPKYAYLEPTDIIRVNLPDTVHRMRIIKTDMQRSGVTQLLATSFNIAMYDFYSNINFTLTNYQIPTPVADTMMELIETPTLPNDTNYDQPILRIALAPDGDNWQGAAVYKSIDDGYDYKLLATAAVASIIGVVMNRLPAAPTVIFDYHNEIIVNLLHGNLSSVSELSLLNGANAALINDELLQFQNAELIGDNIYKLTKLLRGRQGTEEAIGKHKIGDRFVLLNSGLTTVNLNSHLIGRTALYKAVSIGKSLAETEAVERRFEARNLKPLAPVHATAIKKGNGDIIINWIRRSRINGDWRDYVDVPLGEEFEAYQIDIKSGDRLIRTLESTAPNIIYTKEQQETDFTQFPTDITASNITASIYQISAQVGRGYGTTVSL